MRNVFRQIIGEYFWRFPIFLLTSFVVLQSTFPCLLLYVHGMSSVVINASARQTATVIFLHGLGDTGHGWSAGFDEIKLPYVKYICPTAPSKPVTLNMGFKMPSWFDIISLDLGGPEDEDGIKEASKNLRSLIEKEEKNGIPSNRIVIGGFSQGGAVALYTALTNPKPLAGVVALSTWLPLHNSFSEATTGNNSLPIFQAHGDVDPVVKFKYGEKTRDALKKLSTNFTFKQYHGMAHSSCAQEMHDVKEWIKSVLPKQD